MTDLQLKFKLSLKDYDIEFDHSGGNLLFHRWLPNGQEDSIKLETRYPKTELKIWFERFGTVRNNEIVFDRVKQEVDPNIMNKNGILYSGPLFGLFVLKDITVEEKETLRKNEVNDPKYIEFGKKIIRIIDEPIIDLIDLLRIKYGQYWLNRFSRWDSKTTTVGNYFNMFRINFSLDNGINWNKFYPQNVSVTGVSIIGGDYREYFTKNDWKNLSGDVKKTSKFGSASYVLREAEKLLQQKKMKLAFIEGVSALDLALTELYHERFSSLPESQKNVNTFLDLPLPIQLIGSLSLSKKITQNQIQNSLKAIKIRNKIAHTGYDPIREEIQVLRSLLGVILKLLNQSDFRFISSSTGNAIMDDESWKKYYDKFQEK